MKQRLYKIIFETDTKAGKVFDVVLLWLILISITSVIIESVSEISEKYGSYLQLIDWILTIIFTIEYIVRILVSPNKLKYLFSTWGIIDFISVSPSYLSFFVLGYRYLLVIRIIRLMRVFRVLRLVNFTKEGQILLSALKSSVYKIGVFMLFVFILVVLLGTLMYVVENGNSGFSSIPSSIYWGIVTITTVGFGDIVPQTILGKVIASFIMLAGYAIIAIPTGIVSAELTKKNTTQKKCNACQNHIDSQSLFCSNCGMSLT